MQRTNIDYPCPWQHDLTWPHSAASGASKQTVSKDFVDDIMWEFQPSQIQHRRAPGPDELLSDGGGHGKDHQEVFQLPGDHQDVQAVLLPEDHEGHAHASPEVRDGKYVIASLNLITIRSGVVDDTNKNDWYAPGHGDFYKVT